jgi:hypothetical protein
MGKRAVPLILTVALVCGVSLVVPPLAHAAVGIGSPCSKEGSTRTVSPNRTVVCKRNAKGVLTWVKKSSGPTSAGGGAVSDIPSIIENWGFNLGAYDPATRMAGDMSLAPIPFPTGSVAQAPISYYGGGPTRPQDPPDFVDPQMTFFLPINTVVNSIASGTVCWVKKLETGYSDDYSIGIAPACQQDTHNGQGFGTIATWEHEHVMEPMVKYGDKVKAGQPIAKVSYYNSQNWLYSTGYGLYEIGILLGSAQGPMHVCPAEYLAPKKKAALLSQLADAARAYEANTGRSFYDAKTLATGCVTTKVAVERAQR